MQETALSYGYTYGQASGNRVVEGTGQLPDSEPVDVELDGEPAWVVGLPTEDGTAWVVAYADGRVDAFLLDGETGDVTRWFTSPDRLLPGTPPAVVARGGQLELLDAPGVQTSALTHPVPAGDGLLGVAIGGKLFAEPGDDPRVLALPDARIVEADNGSFALLSDPISRYIHGVLGDALEAASITVLSSGASKRIHPESGGVFESISPLWFDPGDRAELLAITESAEGRGSRISVYRPDGELVAAGPYVGVSREWRHLLAAGPFGPGGKVEIAVMRTPHLAPRVEFYQIATDPGELALAASGPGYPSHTIYSRNLDATRAGDLDGDGRWELLVPGREKDELVAVRHEEAGVEVAWKLPLGGVLATNLASATTPSGRAQIAAGRADGVLRVWP